MLFSFENQLSIVGFTLLRYDDTWLIGSQNSDLAGMESSGIAHPISADEYDAMSLGS